MKIDEIASLLSLPNLKRSVDDVEAALDRALRSENSYLVEPGLRVVHGGGKRLRPVLTIAAAAVGVSGEWDDDIVSGAVAVELVHVGSLVHDDIMDNAKERRGVPTVNFVEGVNHAVLVGDYLLARSGVEAARVSKDVAQVLAQTIADLCDGQSRETVDIYNVDRTVDSWMRSVEGKTASLLKASCQIGALSNRLPPDQVDALARYGEAFGVAFQIVDDVLDIVSTSAAMGKPVGNDLREGVYTLPTLYAMEADGGEKLRSELGQPLQDDQVLTLVNKIKAAGGVDRALRLARDFNRRAAEALASIGSTPVAEGLARLPDMYLNWALSEKTAGGYTVSG